MLISQVFFQYQLKSYSFSPLSTNVENFHYLSNVDHPCTGKINPTWL